ncbi:MAG: hypothetical protein R3F07_17870 [Opitutaceae bacterium]
MKRTRRIERTESASLTQEKKRTMADCDRIADAAKSLQKAQMVRLGDKNTALDRVAFLKEHPLTRSSVTSGSFGRDFSQTLLAAIGFSGQSGSAVVRAAGAAITSLGSIGTGAYDVGQGATMNGLLEIAGGYSGLALFALQTQTRMAAAANPYTSIPAFGAAIVQAGAPFYFASRQQSIDVGRWEQQAILAGQSVSNFNEALKVYGTEYAKCVEEVESGI